MPYNESVEEYVRLDINEEKRQPEHKINQARLQSLERILAEYLEQKRILSEAAYNPNIILERDEMDKALNTLFNLLITGKNIREMYDAANMAQARTKDILENRFEIPEIERTKDLEQVKQDDKLSEFAFVKFRPAPLNLDESALVRRNTTIKQRKKPSEWLKWFTNKFWKSKKEEIIIEEPSNDNMAFGYPANPSQPMQSYQNFQQPPFGYPANPNPQTQAYHNYQQQSFPSNQQIPVIQKNAFHMFSTDWQQMQQNENEYYRERVQTPQRRDTFVSDSNQMAFNQQVHFQQQQQFHYPFPQQSNSQLNQSNNPNYQPKSAPWKDVLEDEDTIVYKF